MITARPGRPMTVVEQHTHLDRPQLRNVDAFRGADVRRPVLLAVGVAGIGRDPVTAVQQASRACPGCGKTITPFVYACRTDWYRLPADLRQRINTAWAGVLRGDVDAADEHADAKAETDKLLAR